MKDPLGYIQDDRQVGKDPLGYIKDGQVNKQPLIPGWATASPSGFSIWTAMQMIKNVPESAKNTAQNIIDPILSPVQTAKNIYKLITADPDSWSKVKDYVSGRYGNGEAIYNTFVTDPVGAVTDLSAVLSGSSSLMNLAGKASKLSALSNAGKVVGGVGKTIDPVSQLLSSGTKALGKKVGNIASDFTGAVTGVGPQAIKKAYQASPEFMDGLRGKYNKADLVDEAVGKINKVHGENVAEFAANKAKLQQMGNLQIDKQAITQTLSDLMDDYDIKVAYVGKNGLRPVPDFSASPIARKSQAGIKNIITDVWNWQDWTPAGVHSLKRKIGDMYLPSKEGNAFAAKMYDNVVNSIVDKVPEYAEWMTKYGSTENKLDEITKTLSLGENAMTDTAGRKLASSFADVNDYRLSQLKELDNLAGTNIQDKVAGAIMNPTAPRSQLSKYGGYGMALTGMLTGHPWMGLGLAASSSPRLVGEVASGLGRASQLPSKYPVIDALMPRANMLYETNALANPEQGKTGYDQMYKDLIDRLTQAIPQGGNE